MPGLLYIIAGYTTAPSGNEEARKVFKAKQLCSERRYAASSRTPPNATEETVCWPTPGCWVHDSHETDHGGSPLRWIFQNDVQLKKLKTALGYYSNFRKSSHWVWTT